MKRFSILPFGKPKVKEQIILIYLLAAIIPILITGIFSILRAREQMNKQYESQTRSDASRVNSTLFDITTSLYTSTENIISNNECRRLFGSNFHSQNNTMYYHYISTSLETLRNNSGSVSSICIYTDNPNIPDNAYIKYIADGYSNEPWHSELKENQWNNWTYLKSNNRYNQTVTELALVRRIPTIGSEFSAFLVVQLDSNYLKNRLLQNDYLIMVSIDNKPVFFSSDTSKILGPMAMPPSFHQGYFTYNGPVCIDGINKLCNVITLRSYKTDNLFYTNVIDLSAYKNMNLITFMYFIILAIATIFPTILILLFSSYFSGRVQTLKTAMHQTSEGDYNIMPTFLGDDELTETFKDLYTTVETIREKESLYYSAQINEQKLINKQQQMEFKMLICQINPHFLYNTLETIRMQALSAGNKDVATSIKLLGKSMHYVLENTGTDFTTLDKELTYVKTYLTIQRLRFGDRVNYQFHMPDDFDSGHYRILPLLIQPIVENAINHGLEGVQENGLIDITVTPSSTCLLIVVTDNGEGIEPALLLKLIERMNQKSLRNTGKIGLYNINQRIKLAYGSDYGLSIKSHLNQGTTVTLTLPLPIN